MTPHQPGHADRQRDFVPGERTQLRQLVEMGRDVHIDSPAGGEQHGAGAMRIDSWLGLSAGIASAIRRARSN